MTLNKTNKTEMITMPKSYYDALSLYRSCIEGYRAAIEETEEAIPRYQAEIDAAKAEAAKASAEGNLDAYKAAKKKEHEAEDLHDYYVARQNTLKRNSPAEADEIEAISRNLATAKEEIDREYEQDFMKKYFAFLEEAEVLASKFELLKAAAEQVTVQLKKGHFTSYAPWTPRIIFDMEKSVKALNAWSGTFKGKPDNIPMSAGQRPITEAHREEFDQKSGAWL